MKPPSKAKNSPFLFASFVCVLFASPLYAQNAGKVNLEPIEKWIEKHRDLKSLYVEFVQERKLPTMKNPTTAPGKMWMSDSGNLFRMETGIPARSITLKNAKETVVINTKKKTAEILGGKGKLSTRAAQMEEMFQHLFPKSMADL